MRNRAARFAKAVYEERSANHGVMLAWNFPDARKAAQILAVKVVDIFGNDTMTIVEVTI